MPEPLTIVTSAIGFATALVTIRNTITRILKDYDVIKYRSEKLIPTSIRLKKLHDDISYWQKAWHIHKGTPKLLPVTYWGLEDYILIEELLQQTRAISVRIQEEFEARFRESIRKLKANHVKSMDPAEADSSNHQIKNLSKLKQKLKHSTDQVSEAWWAVLIEPLYQKHLKELEDLVKLLQEHSKDLFVRHVNKGSEAGWETRRSSIQAQIYLICLATEYSHASAFLQEFLVGRQTHKFDLHLSPDVEASERVEHLAKILRDDSLEFRLSSRTVHESNPGDVDVICSMPQQVDDFEFRHFLAQQYETLFGGTVQPENGRRNVVTPSTQQGTPLTNPWKVVSNEASNECGISKSKNLRSFMIRNQPKFDESLHGPFMRRERHRLAYELAEWALIFLKTEWYAEICSCRVLRIENEDLSTAFRTRIGAVRHVDTTIDHIQTQQWCEVELPRMHIRRLGVLLMEIAVGYPVLDVAFHRRHGLEIDEVLNMSDQERTTVLRRTGINEKVRHAMGTKFMKVVDYCLQQQSDPQQITEADINQFYSKVVYPLFQYYHRYYIKPRETDED